MGKYKTEFVAFTIMQSSRLSVKLERKNILKLPTKSLKERKKVRCQAELSRKEKSKDQENLRRRAQLLITRGFILSSLHIRFREKYPTVVLL